MFVPSALLLVLGGGEEREGAAGEPLVLLHLKRGQGQTVGSLISAYAFHIRVPP